MGDQGSGWQACLRPHPRVSRQSHRRPRIPRDDALGYDIVDHIREACDLDTIIEYPDNLQFGVRAEYIEVLVTRK